jgi:hypothetical protein
MITNRRSFLTAAGLGLLGTAMASPFHQNADDNAIKTEFAFKAEITLDKVLELGNTQHGNRRIIPITGGSFEGPQIQGTILPGGADWQIIRTDSVAELEARYTLQTSDNALIYVLNRGYRHGPPEVMQRLSKGEPVDPKEYYFRATPVFETSAENYKWLTRYIFIATGERRADRVILDFYKLL